jgi:hypothetical protein
MARYTFPLGNDFGVRYQTAMDISRLDEYDRLQVGQWVKRRNHPKLSRLVPNGHLIHPSGAGPKRKQRVNQVAFRLACGRSLADVLGTAYVDVTPVTPERVLQLIA